MAAKPFAITVTTSGVSHRIPLPGMSVANYAKIIRFLKERMEARAVGRETIADTFELAIDLCPNANQSDIFHHVIYRRYLELSSSQSWVRTSGEAFELFLSRYYNRLLGRYGIRLRPLFGSKERQSALTAMGIPASMGQSKLDIAVEGSNDQQRWTIFGGVHAKGSLAERISDDVPVSERMMQLGYWSGLCTLDMKSYPPRDLTNRGELGTPAKPSDKRGYIEDKGSFSACYSYNLRTVPSADDTSSGRRIYRLTFKREEDQFCADVQAAWLARSQPPL